MVTSPNVSQMNINNIEEASQRGLLKGNGQQNTLRLAVSNTPTSNITLGDPSPQTMQECYSRYSVLGREFVRQYYTMLGEHPNLVFRFYSADSTYTFNEGMPVFGQTNIAERINAMNLDACHTKIRSVDTHEGLHGMAIIQVVGELSIGGAQPRCFVQTFVLAPRTERKYYVHNDMFRYLDDLFVDKTNDADVLTSVSPATTNEKCAMVVNGLHEENNDDSNQRAPQQVSYRHQPLPPRTLVTSTSMTDSGIVPFSAESSPEWPTSTTTTLPMAAHAAMAQSQITTPVTVYAQTQLPTVHHQVPPRSDANMSTALTTILIDDVSGVKGSTAAPADAESPLSTVDDTCRPMSAAGKDSSTAASNAGDDTEDGGVGGGSTAAASPESWARRVAGKQATAPISHKPRAAQPLVTAVAQPAPPTATAIPASALPLPTVVDALLPQTSRESPAPSSSSGGVPGGASYGGGRGAGPYRQSQHYGGGRGNGHDAASAADESAREVFVRFLPEDVIRSELYDAFSKIGHIESVHVVSRPNIGARFNSFAFVRFDNAKSVNDALAQKTFYIRGQLAIHAEVKLERGRPMGGGERVNMGDRMTSGGGGPSMRGRGGMGGRGGYRGGRGSSGGGNTGPGSRFYTNSNQRPQPTTSGFGGGGGFNQPPLQTSAMSGGGGF